MRWGGEGGRVMGSRGVTSSLTRAELMVARAARARVSI